MPKEIECLDPDDNVGNSLDGQDDEEWIAAQQEHFAEQALFQYGDSDPVEVDDVDDDNPNEWPC